MGLAVFGGRGARSLLLVKAEEQEVDVDEQAAVEPQEEQEVPDQEELDVAAHAFEPERVEDVKGQQKQQL